MKPAQGWKKAVLSIGRMHAIVAAVFALLASAAWPQAADYSKSASIFPNFTGQYRARIVPEVNFSNSARITGLIRDGKLLLSLNDAVALALENNLDLVIARYNLPIADTDILRTKAGASARGVNVGVLSGTSGGEIVSVGATGGGAGGTSAAAGGVGSGTNGLVNSTLGAGPSVDSFDPTLTSSLGIQHTWTQEANTILYGVSSLNQNTGTANFAYSQGFPTGTLFTVDFNNSRLASNSTNSVLLPQLSSSFLVQLRQHLLQGFSPASNRRYIIQARNNREIADVAFRQQIISTVSQVENIYWNVVNAFENLKAQKRALQAAEQLLSDNRKQVAIGTLAAVEVVSAEAQVATNEQKVIVAQTNLQLQQLYLKNAITKNQDDPVLAATEIVPSDRMKLPEQETITPAQDLIAEALQNRPELAESRIDLSTRQLSMRAIRNALLPSLDLVANYGGNGLAGALNPNYSGSTNGLTNTGYFDALSSLGSHPTYYVGFSVTIPIRNRAAQADAVRSQLEFRQAEARLQQIKNQIAIDVRNAQFSLQQNRARVDAATKARDYAQYTLDAERKKFAYGASTTYNVMTQLNNLTAAESNLVTTMAAYQQSRVAMQQVTGTTLETLGIEIGEAETGNLNHLPIAPGVVPATPEQLSLDPAPISETRH